MDIKGPSRFRGAKSSPSTNRFLGEHLHARSQNPSPASSSTGYELCEDDIFSAGDLSGDANNPYSQPSTPSSSSSTPRRLQGRQNCRSSFGQFDSFGILSALPENGNHRVLKHKTSVPSSSSSRTVPTIPKPPDQRWRARCRWNSMKWRTIATRPRTKTGKCFHRTKLLPGA